MIVDQFLDRPGQDDGPLVVFPISYEKTTSYLQGTAAAPQAILDASGQVEFYDHGFGGEICEIGIRTLPVLDCTDLSQEDAFDRIRQTAGEVLSAGKCLVSVGGEHTVTIPLVDAAVQEFGQIGVVQFDAHFDFREAYLGDRYSHACVMRRCHEFGVVPLSVGVRSFCRDELDFVTNQSIAYMTGDDVYRTPEHLSVLSNQLPEIVYVTVDFDFFAPSEFSVGTPVPGGPLWYPGVEMIRALFESKRVVGMDFVELCPNGDASAFSAASLIYQVMGFCR